MRESYKLLLYDGATTTDKSKSIMVLLFGTHKGNLLGLAQMVERPLGMREVPGSTPGFSTFIFFITTFFALSQNKKYCPFEVHLQFIILFYHN